MVPNFLGLEKLKIIQGPMASYSIDYGGLGVGTWIDTVWCWTMAEAYYCTGFGFGKWALVVVISIYWGWNHQCLPSQQYLLSKSLYFIDRNSLMHYILLAMGSCSTCPCQRSCCDYVRSCCHRCISWLIFIIHAFGFSLFSRALEAE